MPTILELFNKSKERKQIPQPKAKSYVADSGQFLIDRENRLGNSLERRFDPLTETQLEQELSGLRPMRLINSPTLYGTDIIRITSQKTSDVEAMKLSKNPDANISLGKIGKFLEKTSDFVNKTLGIPKNVFPTYVINTKEFKEGNTPNKIITLGEITKDARGTALGRFLKSTGAGTPNQLAKQSFGQGINLIKGAVRTALIGDRIIPITSGSLDNFTQKYFEDEFRGTYSVSMNSFLQPDSTSTFDISKVSPVFGLDRSTTEGYPGLFGTPRRFANRAAIYGFQLSDGTANQKAGEPTQQELIDEFNTPLSPYTQPDGNTTALGGPSPLLDTKLKTNNLLDFIRPQSLQKNNWKKDRYSTDTTTKTYHNNGETKYDNTLDKRRGISSERDIINQTGRLAASELDSLKYNGKTLDEVDLIPLKFQKVNDGSLVFFRALVTGFNEQFSPGWENSKMLGSPFNFYNYTGIERKVSFTLKAYSMSQAELIMMWRKLEYLAHCTYPHQYNEGIVEPTILYFTFGSIYNKKECFVDSLSYSIENEENLWELGGGLLKTKNGTFEKTFNDKFYAGQSNSTNEPALNVASEATGVYQTDIVEIKESLNEIYDKKTKVSNLIDSKRNIKTSVGNYNMDNYKLPKIINVSVNLTFIETRGTTSNNIYGYGKKIK